MSNLPGIGLCLLLVEDDPVVASREKHDLELAGYDLVVARTGEEAVELALTRNPPFALALVDVGLGMGMDGVQTASAILRHRELPVVFLSSHTEREFVERTRSVASYGYVVKESGPFVLEATVRTALELFRSHEAERRKEAELADIRRSLEAVVEGSGAGTWDWRMDTGQLVVNDRYVTMLGYDRTEMDPSTHGVFKSLVNPEDLPRSDRITEEYERGERKTHEIVLRFRHKDGHWVYVLDRGMVTERDAAGRPVRMSGMHFDISAIKRAEEEQARLVGQKETLMKELQHRVKNSLAVVSSLLGLEMDKLGEGTAREAFAGAIGRIRSVSLIYERLYLSDDLATVDLATYVGEVAGSLVKTFASARAKVRLELDLEPVGSDSKRAVLLGLILCELLINAIKYAYPSGDGGPIRVRVEGRDGSIILRVDDEGVGLPEGLDPGKAKSLGLHLVAMLAAQVDGRVEFGKADGRGTRAEVILPASSG